MLIGLFAKPHPDISATHKGYVGLAPARAALGDIICIIFGAFMPYTLRPDGPGKCQLIGESYVHGICDGEYLHQDPETTVFDVC